MEILISIIILLVLLLVTNVLAHYISFIPIALIQIAVGILAALVAKDFTIEIEAEWFLLLFIAPLLYYDGAHFPREQLWKMRLPILGNAIVLVLLTTIVGGLFVHWMIPSIPLAAAFALMAILSPTDPVAVNSIAKRVHIPDRIMNLVRGESLINDASGLIAFKYSVAAIVTGYFSLKSATSDFLYMFFVGLIIGIFGALAIFLIRLHLRRIGIVDSTFYVLLQVLTPFLLYLIAEEVFHASGVITVVTGGIIAAIVKEKTENFIAQEQVVTEHVWSIVTFTLNGVIFLLLGLMLPSATNSILVSEEIRNSTLILYVLGIGLMVLVIRFAWVMFFNIVDKKIFKNEETVTIKDHIVTTLVGVRGTITMVGILSLPLVTNQGELFPNRQLLIFLAAGVILFTLIMATIFLPLLNEQDKAKQPNLMNEKREMLKHAIRSIQHETVEENAAIALKLMNQYNAMLLNIERKQSEEAFQKYRQQMLEARKVGMELEIIYTKQYMAEHGLNESIQQEIDYILKERKDMLNNRTFTLLKRRLRHFLRERKMSKLPADVVEQINHVKKDLKDYVTSSIIKHVQETNEFSLDIVQKVEIYYRHLQYSSYKMDSSEQEEQKEYLALIAIEAQRNLINEWYQAGDINNELAKELRRFVNNLESVILLEEEE
ncbi:sodium:proton antiporter [Lysinibacillus agricola]|uniref:Sodium:proton antiporter n=1 Tax=Lysinibacillus agricola TaxID=2590012 RepID=A0ABX7AN27_9BACI|nr:MULTISPECIES: sodium:proton antiporter [Lysinibacillus]KOS59887.1 sodium:proton antiporter [Lysinibacillus sp. FJAT-14222]QQP10667.1 sodium:proton antiporter [Lysinibacillus agricola]